MFVADGQGAVAAGDHRAVGAVGAAGNRGQRAWHQLALGTNTAHLTGFAIGAAVHVGVVVEHIAGRVIATTAIGYAAGFHRYGLVVLTDRRIVGPAQRHTEHGAGGSAFQISHLVGKGFAQRLAGQQCLHYRVIVAHQVLVIALTVDHQIAVFAGQGHATLGGHQHRVTAGGDRVEV